MIGWLAVERNRDGHAHRRCACTWHEVAQVGGSAHGTLRCHVEYRYVNVPKAAARHEPVRRTRATVGTPRAGMRHGPKRIEARAMQGDYGAARGGRGEGRGGEGDLGEGDEMR